MSLKYYFNETFLGEEKTKTREDKRMVELDLKTKIPPKMPSLGKYQKNQHIHVLVHGHFSWSTFGLHLVGGTNGFVKWFFKKLDHQVGPWKKAIFHGLTSWSMV